MNYIYKYNSKIQNGEIITSKKVKAVYNALTQDLKSKKDNIYFHTVILLSAHFYDNRSFLTEKAVYQVPYSLDCLIKHIGMRGDKYE